MEGQKIELDLHSMVNSQYGMETAGSTTWRACSNSKVYPTWWVMMPGQKRAREGTVLSTRGVSHFASVVSSRQRRDLSRKHLLQATSHAAQLKGRVPRAHACQVLHCTLHTH